MDLHQADEFGNPWDFNCAVMRNNAKAIVKSKAALPLIASPMRAAFSRRQSLNAPRLGEQKVKDILEHGVNI